MRARARARRAADGRARRLHQRRQVHAAERAHRRRRGVRERLFHTLDPTTRSFEIGGRTYLLTDTVGFIRKLPHQLVEAFAATLEEALGADLIAARRRRLGARGGAARDARGRRRGAGRDRRGRAPAPARAEQGRPARRRAPARAVASASRARSRCRPRRARASRPCARRSRRASSRTLRPMELLLPYEEGGTPVRAARPRRRARARGHRRGRARAARGCPPRRSPALRALRDATAATRRVRLRFRAPDRGGAPAGAAHDGDAGYDLHAAEAVTIAPGERASVGTGIAVAIPRRPRRAGAAALGPGGAPRHLGRQRARADRLRLPRRAAGAAAEHRPRREPSRSSRATGSRSSCSWPSSAPSSRRSTSSTRPRAAPAASAPPAASSSHCANRRKSPASGLVSPGCATTCCGAHVAGRRRTGSGRG